jgi:hypothetical protein
VRPLDEEAVRAASARNAGVGQPLEDPDLDRALEAIVRSVNRDPSLSPLGRRMAEGQLTEALSTRLRIAKLTETETPLAPVLFIIGPARTGTTLLQRLLAEDPQARSPRLWELDHPIPQPRAASYSTDPRIDQTREQLRVWRTITPEIFEMHPMDATSPEEDNSILQRGFLAATWLAVLGSNREFEAWVRDNGDANAEGAYRYHRRELGYLQSDFSPTHWVLKSPTHVFGLRALLSTYPDAWVLNTYREPAEWVASLCQLHWVFRSTVSTIDRATVGAEVLRWWGPAIDRMLELRNKHPNRFVDVDYREMVTAPVDLIRRIYERTGLDYDDVSERRMRDQLAGDQFLKEKAYTTRLEQFGLDRAGVDDRFAHYRAEYGMSGRAHG